MNNYFPHDSNSRNSDKLLPVRMKFGAEGYGIYFMILERLREEKEYMSVKDYNMIAFDLRVDAQKVKSIVEDFGLFAFTDNGECFYSEGFLKRMEIKDEKSKKRSDAGKKGAAKRWQTDSNAIAKPLANDSKESKGKETKLKESKEKNTTTHNPLRIYNYLESNGFGSPFGNLMAEKISSWLSDLQGKGLSLSEADEWLIAAIDDTLLNGARSFTYAERIMDRRFDANIFTPEAIQGDRSGTKPNKPSYQKPAKKRASEPWWSEMTNDDWAVYEKLSVDEQKKYQQERGG